MLVEPGDELMAIGGVEGTVRRAVAEDAESIERLMQRVWNDKETHAVHIAHALGDTAHATFVALFGNNVIGFVDGFTTCTIERQLRWEIDLLAVDELFRNQGWGERLVRKSMEEGELRQASHARALIKLDNHSSQHVFLGCGFRPQEDLCNLVVSKHGLDEPLSGQTQPKLARVNTFNYSGAWLEPPVNLDAMRDARVLQTSNGWDVVGAVIPNADAQLMRAAVDSGYSFIDHYQWWLID